VSDATFNAMRDKFGERGVIDLIGLSGYYAMLAMVLNVGQQPLPGGVPPPLPVLG
jgi:4-carboxymuconolactone decarboxylase